MATVVEVLDLATYIATGGVWPRPAGVTTLDYVICTGGGGGGAGGVTGGLNGGGGGGGCNVEPNVDVSGFSTWNYLIGAAGAGGTNGAPTGVAGGDTVFDSGFQVFDSLFGAGGLGGSTTAGGAGGGVGNNGFNGGSGGRVGISTSGGGGGGAAGGGADGETAPGQSQGVGGDPSGFDTATPDADAGGQGGIGGSNGNSGANGSTPGGGGGGAGTNVGGHGGNGAAGRIILIYQSAAAAPTITSNGGGATVSISVAENTTAVTTVVATGDFPIVYSKSGTDAAKFTINSSSGVLAFASAPDYETPTDANTDNAYLVTVTATNGTGADSQDLTVTVTNVIIPVNTVAPTITTSNGGTSTWAGYLISIVHGAWNNSPTGYIYKHQAGPSTSGPWTDIGGATNQTFTTTTTQGGFYVRSGELASNSEGAAAAYVFSDPVFVFARVALPTPRGFGTLANTTAFNGQFIFNEAISDTLNEPMPSPLTLNTQTPVSQLDTSWFFTGTDGGTIYGLGLCKIADLFGLMGVHGALAVGQLCSFRASSGTVYTRTIAAVYPLGGNGYLAIAKFDSPLPQIPNVPILADSALVDNLYLLALELDRHWNRLQVQSGLDNSDLSVSLLDPSGDVIEGGDSGKPAGPVFLSGSTYQFAVALAAFYTSSGGVAAGPNASHGLNEIADVLAYSGEAPVLAVRGATDDSPSISQPIRSSIKRSIRSFPTNR